MIPRTGNTMAHGYSRAWNEEGTSSNSFTELKVRSTTKLWRGSRGALWSGLTISSSAWCNRFSGSLLRS
jgi:hypothetical protein